MLYKMNILTIYWNPRAFLTQEIFEIYIFSIKIAKSIQFGSIQEFKAHWEIKNEKMAVFWRSSWFWNFMIHHWYKIVIATDASPRFGLLIRFSNIHHSHKCYRSVSCKVLDNSKAYGIHYVYIHSEWNERFNNLHTLFVPYGTFINQIWPKKQF